MFEVIVPASSTALLTIEELRAVVGLTAGDTSRDVELAALGESISALIIDELNLADDGINPPSILTEQVRDTLHIRRCDRVEDIVLSRRPLSNIVSVVENDVELAADGWEPLRAAGILTRINSGMPRRWHPGKIVVTYEAGFPTVPPLLKLAARKVVSTVTKSDERDPNLKEETIEGVGKWVYWVQPTAQSLITADIEDLISNFRLAKRLA